MRWKQFAIDFDEISPPPPPPMPDPTPEIVEAMRDMNVYTDRNGIDLANDIEEYLGGKVARDRPVPRIWRSRREVARGSRPRDVSPMGHAQPPPSSRTSARAT